MSRSETLEAWEEGLITQEEALEQALVDDVDSLYEQVATERGHSAAGSGQGAPSTARSFHS